jgi:hypothetical protein
MLDAAIDTPIQLGTSATSTYVTPSGKIIYYAVGGSGLGGIYDPKTRQFTPSKLPDGMVSRVPYSTGPATTSVGGKSFFAGGLTSEGFFQANPSDSVFIFDEKTNHWSTQQLSVARAVGAAVSAGDDAIFAGGILNDSIGGPLAVSDQVDIYNVQTGLWSVAHLSQAAPFVRSAVIGDRAFFLGSAYGNPAFSLDVFDARTGAWSTLKGSDLTVDSMTAVGQDLVFTCEAPQQLPNGSSQTDRFAKVFNSRTGKWSRQTFPLTGTYAATEVVGHEAVFYGGSIPGKPNASGTIAYILPKFVRVFNSDTNSWKKVAMPLAIGEYSYSIRPSHVGSKVVVVSDSGVLESLDLATGKSTTYRLLQKPDPNAVFQSAGDSLFLIGSTSLDQITLAKSFPPTPPVTSVVVDGLSHQAMNLPQPGSGVVSTVLGNEIYYVVGDVGSQPNYLPEPVQIYNSTTHRWRTDRRASLYNISSATSVDGKVLLVGSDLSLQKTIVSIYDSKTNRWSQVDRGAYRELIACTSVGDVAIFAGGKIPVEPDIGALADVYDALTGQWSRMQMPTPLENGLAVAGSLAASTEGPVAVSVGGRAIFTDGLNFNAFDLATGLWSTRQPVQLSSYTAAVIGTKAYFAGRNIYGDQLPIDVYDSLTDQWSGINYSPNAPSDFTPDSAIGLGGKLIVNGTFTLNKKKRAAVQIYDTDTGLWSGTGMVTERQNVNAVSLDAKAESRARPNFRAMI